MKCYKPTNEILDKSIEDISVHVWGIVINLSYYVIIVQQNVLIMP